MNAPASPSTVLWQPSCDAASNSLSGAVGALRPSAIRPARRGGRGSKVACVAQNSYAKPRENEATIRSAKDGTYIHRVGTLPSGKYRRLYRENRPPFAECVKLHGIAYAGHSHPARAAVLHHHRDRAPTPTWSLKEPLLAASRRHHGDYICRPRPPALERHLHGASRAQEP